MEAATSNEEGSNAEGQSKTATVKNVQIKTDCKLDSTDEKATFKNVQISYDVEKLILSGSANVEKILAESDETATVEIESEDVKIEKTTENVELTTPENSQIQIPTVEKIDTYYTVSISAYPFAQGSMKLPEGFLFSTEEITFEDVQLEGWYLDSLFTQKATFPHVVNSDVTFYAKFILDKKCKIIFYGNAFINEKTFDYGTLIKESDIPDLTEEVKEYGYIWEGWYLDYETTQPLTFPFVITRDIALYPKVSQMEGNTGNGETPDDTGNSGNSGTGNSGETDDDDSIISEVDFSIPVTSQEDFEFTVGTWLCEQTSKQGSLDSMIQTTTSKLVFTITETLPTSSIQAIAEKHETIVTYASQYFSSYEQAKQQYPTSVPEYEFTFDDANLTITMVASKESLNEISAGYSAITYEQFVSGYLTFGDTIENFTNSEKTALKSINNPDSNIKIETIFVKIADDNSGNSGTGNSGETDDDDSIISEVDFSIPVTSQEDFEFTV
ncbi:MAG: InlB B-repeat-containing protein, partial [Treponemataceae bacterium]|nr:InlB B-repeat-containing protein [Treponemataceae bacterium]